eukprot:SAG11_NODE_1357_length_5120_cov_2.888668_2_plen_37_part_00
MPHRSMCAFWTLNGKGRLNYWQCSFFLRVWTEKRLA